MSARTAHDRLKELRSALEGCSPLGVQLTSCVAAQGLLDQALTGVVSSAVAAGCAPLPIWDTTYPPPPDIIATGSQPPAASTAGMGQHMPVATTSREGFAAEIMVAAEPARPPPATWMLPASPATAMALLRRQANTWMLALASAKERVNELARCAHSYEVRLKRLASHLAAAPLPWGRVRSTAPSLEHTIARYQTEAAVARFDREEERVSAHVRWLVAQAPRLRANLRALAAAWGPAAPAGVRTHGDAVPACPWSITELDPFPLHAMGLCLSPPVPELPQLDMAVLAQSMMPPGQPTPTLPSTLMPPSTAPARSTEPASHITGSQSRSCAPSSAHGLSYTTPSATVLCLAPGMSPMASRTPSVERVPGGGGGGTSGAQVDEDGTAQAATGLVEGRGDGEELLGSPGLDMGSVAGGGEETQETAALLPHSTFPTPDATSGMHLRGSSREDGGEAQDEEKTTTAGGSSHLSSPAALPFHYSQAGPSTASATHSHAASEPASPGVWSPAHDPAAAQDSQQEQRSLANTLILPSDNDFFSGLASLMVPQHAPATRAPPVHSTTAPQLTLRSDISSPAPLPTVPVLHLPTSHRASPSGQQVHRTASPLLGPSPRANPIAIPHSPARTPHAMAASPLRRRRTSSSLFVGSPASAAADAATTAAVEQMSVCVQERWSGNGAGRGAGPSRSKSPFAQQLHAFIISQVGAGVGREGHGRSTGTELAPAGPLPSPSVSAAPQLDATGAIVADSPLMMPPTASPSEALADAILAMPVGEVATSLAALDDTPVPCPGALGLVAAEEAGGAMLPAAALLTPGPPPSIPTSTAHTAPPAARFAAVFEEAAATSRSGSGVSCSMGHSESHNDAGLARTTSAPQVALSVRDLQMSLWPSQDGSHVSHTGGESTRGGGSNLWSFHQHVRDDQVLAVGDGSGSGRPVTSSQLQSMQNAMQELMAPQDLFRTGPVSASVPVHGTWQWMEHAALMLGAPTSTASQALSVLAVQHAQAVQDLPGTPTTPATPSGMEQEVGDSSARLRAARLWKGAAAAQMSHNMRRYELQEQWLRAVDHLLTQKQMADASAAVRATGIEPHAAGAIPSPGKVSALLRVRALRRTISSRIDTASALWARLVANKPLLDIGPLRTVTSAAIVPSEDASVAVIISAAAEHVVGAAAINNDAATTQAVSREATHAASGTHMPLEAWGPRPGSPARLLPGMVHRVQQQLRIPPAGGPLLRMQMQQQEEEEEEQWQKASSEVGSDASVTVSEVQVAQPDHLLPHSGPGVAMREVVTVDVDILPSSPPQRTSPQSSLSEPAAATVTTTASHTPGPTTFEAQPDGVEQQPQLRVLPSHHAARMPSLALAHARSHSYPRSDAAPAGGDAVVEPVQASVQATLPLPPLPQLTIRTRVARGGTTTGSSPGTSTPASPFARPEVQSSSHGKTGTSRTSWDVGGPSAQAAESPDAVRIARRLRMDAAAARDAATAPDPPESAADAAALNAAAADVAAALAPAHAAEASVPSTATSMPAAPEQRGDEEGLQQPGATEEGQVAIEAWGSSEAGASPPADVGSPPANAPSSSSSPGTAAVPGRGLMAALVAEVTSFPEDGAALAQAAAAATTADTDGVVQAAPVSLMSALVREVMGPADAAALVAAPGSGSGQESGTEAGVAGGGAAATDAGVTQERGTEEGTASLPSTTDPEGETLGQAAPSSEGALCPDASQPTVTPLVPQGTEEAWEAGAVGAADFGSGPGSLQDGDDQQNVNGAADMASSQVTGLADLVGPVQAATLGALPPADQVRVVEAGLEWEQPMDHWEMPVVLDQSPRHGVASASAAAAEPMAGWEDEHGGQEAGEEAGEGRTVDAVVMMPLVPAAAVSRTLPSQAEASEAGDEGSGVESAADEGHMEFVADTALDTLVGQVQAVTLGVLPPAEQACTVVGGAQVSGSSQVVQPQLQHPAAGPDAGTGEGSTLVQGSDEAGAGIDALMVTAGGSAEEGVHDAAGPELTEQHHTAVGAAQQGPELLPTPALAAAPLAPQPLPAASPGQHQARAHPLQLQDYELLASSGSEPELDAHAASGGSAAGGTASTGVVAAGSRALPVRWLHSVLGHWRGHAKPERTDGGEGREGVAGQGRTKRAHVVLGAAQGPSSTAAAPVDPAIHHQVDTVSAVPVPGALVLGGHRSGKGLMKVAAPGASGSHTDRPASPTCSALSDRLSMRSTSSSTAVSMGAGSVSGTSQRGGRRVVVSRVKRAADVLGTPPPAMP